MRKRNKIMGFTLIEMLAVMFIIGIIFSITVPAFGPIMRTMKLTTAAENLANTLESARQYAVTSGIDCYVVFPTNTAHTDLDYKAYKVYSYDGTTGYTVGKWEILPTGLRIAQDSSFFSVSEIISIPFPEDTDTSQSVESIHFKTSGKATRSATVKIEDTQTSTFGCVTFYNSPAKVKMWDLRYQPSRPEEPEV